MIFEFLPPLFPERAHRAPSAATPAPAPARSASVSRPDATVPRFGVVVLMVTIALILLGIGVLIRGIPRIDPTANALRPRNSPAYAALDEIKKELNQNREPLWIIIGGKTETEVSDRLQAVQQALAQALSNHVVHQFALPLALWPRPEFQTANRNAARQLAAERPLLAQAALTNGFTPSALGLTDQMLTVWEQASRTPGVFWPANELCDWIFNKVTARTPTNCFAFGLITPPPDRSRRTLSRLAQLESELQIQGALLSGWELLGEAIFGRVRHNMWRVVAPMLCLVLLSLGLAFRRAGEILLSLAVLILSGLCLLVVMRLAGWSWNLLNLMAVPLILGTGVDYSIFMQLALRRHEGDLGMAYHSVGRALLLCGGTACAGFGSLGLSSNAGMASLGQVCAVGIASNMIISIFLLPVWWRSLVVQSPKSKVQSPKSEVQSPKSEVQSPMFTGESENRSSITFHASRFTHHVSRVPHKPSTLYCAQIWRVGLWIVRILPSALCTLLGHALADLYWFLAIHRREVVFRNLLPGCGNDTGLAQKKTRKLFHQFALKLVDLWRYEAGLPIDHLFGGYTGWEHFIAGQSQRRGVLLLTPHLGNWEFGAPWLTRRGVALQVITMAEPTQDFTALREASRRRWNIETLVIGEDPFAFLEVIKRLEGGATVALLVDRPPPATAVTVELFGRAFAASVAAAELARASGCVLLPVFLPRVGQAYDAHILPPILYDRASLRDRTARQELTQKIISAFEPTIRQYLDQWYHFVPVWPEGL